MNNPDSIKCLLNRMHHNLLDEILPFWLKYSPDKVNGGFFGRISRDGTGITDAPKSLVLNARILWTFSASYHMFGNSLFLETADRAFDYIITHFIKNDPEFEGGYWLLNANGSVREAVGNMHTYGQSFLLYAFSEYAAITNNPKAYKYAELMFNFIEQYCRLGNVYTEKPNQNKTDKLMLSMNTHLHIIEAITNYFRICKDKRVEASLLNLIELFLNTIYNKKTHHQNMFFTADGIPISDKISYGHDIEFSWLLTEAVEVLRENSSENLQAALLYDRCVVCVLEIVDSVYREGLDSNCGALFDEGTPSGEILHQNKIWWIQAEAVVGFFNAWQICGDERYLNAACGVMDYIDRNILDTDYGEWYSTGVDSFPKAQTGYKADEWKCPYHNSRMALEVISRISNTILI
ncbi:MAG: AGE family epimerase/isomerase [Eubacteriales bacterium]